MPRDEYLGPYRIGELLGRGGMGNVYVGTHAKTGDRVAVKLIAAHVSDDPRFRRRFDREIRALKMLRHPGIVTIIGEGEDDDGRLFYSMELIEGETLQSRVRRLKKLPWQEVIDIAIEICAALKHAHDIGVTHRDLKPANLIVTTDGRIKIVDFGIPKVFGDQADQTQAGSILGTPDYMAPEQASGDPITPRTDLYSLGSVMYACLVGRAPFKGKNSTEVIDSLRRDRPIPLGLINADLPPELVELVHQLLEKAPEQRPPTALSAMNRLKSMRAGLQHQATLSLEDEGTDFGPGKPSTRSNDTVGKSAGTSGFDHAEEKPKSRDRTRDDASASEATSMASGMQVTAPNMTVSGKSAKTRRPGEPLSSNKTSPVATPSPAVAPEQVKASRARFATVESTFETARSSHPRDATESKALRQMMTVAAMIATLAGFALLVYRSTRPATADQLYETILTDNSLVSMDAFLREFPGDDRFADVKAMQMEKRIATTLRRLNAQKTIGLKPLSPAEEGFAASMEERQTAPIETTERLTHWIDAFATDENGMDPSVAELIELARHQKSALRDRSVGIPMDPRSMALLDEIRSARETLSAEETVRKLRGIIETFKESDWAAPAVREAERALERLASPR